MDTLCRVCIKKAAICTPLNTKIEDSLSLSFLDFLNKCTSLNACERDSLPQSLCSICTHSIKTFYSFVKLAEKSDTILREAFKNLIATGRHNDNGERSYEESAIKSWKVKKEPEDFNKEDSFHCQTSKPGSSLYILDIVKEEPRVSKSTSVIEFKEAETEEIDKLHSNIDCAEGRIEETSDTLSCIVGDLADIVAEHSVSEDDIAISLLKTRLVKNMDEMNSQSNTLSKAHFISSNVKEEIFVPDTEILEATEICENNESFFLKEEIDETENKVDQFKDIDIEDIPLSYLKKLLHSGRVENEAIETIDNKAEAASDTQSSNFCCNTCHQIFKIENDFENHMKIVHSTRKQTKKHKGEGRFKCKLCKNTYHSKIGLWHHKRLMHNGNKRKTKFMCTICDKRFFTRQNCRDHQLVHKKKKKKYSCSLCSKEFARQTLLRKHVRAHTRDGSYKCEKCKIVFKDQEEFRTHCRKHIYEKNRGECKTCGKTFAHLHNHLKVHTGNKPFKCETCGKQFRRKTDYQIHLRTHMEISYPCPHCRRKYKSKKYLQVHIDRHINSKIQCEECNKKYIYRYELQRHIKKCKFKMHKDDDGNQFKCETCKKFFKSKYSLKAHMDIHKGVTHTCNQCGKQFKSSNTLRNHLRIFHHIRKKPEIYDISNAQLRYAKHLEVCKLHGLQRTPKPNSKTKIKIENERQVDPELLDEIKIETTQEEIDKFYEATEAPVIHIYKTEDLADNKYFELTDECIKGLSNNS